MNTDEASDASPFAAFAMPKRNAAEEFQERQRRAAVARRKMIGSVLSCLVGSTVGATACAAFDGDFDTVLTAFVGAMIGSSGGAVLGVIVGAMCFGALSMTRMRGGNVEAEFARRDPMNAMRGLMFAWALIGSALGASIGARTGASWAGADLAQLPLARWTMIGSLIGGGFALAVWFFTLRKLAGRDGEAAT